MGLNVGNKPVKAVYVGSTPVKAVYVGATMVWQSSVIIKSAKSWGVYYWDPSSVAGNSGLIAEWSGRSSGDLRGMVTFNVDVTPSTTVYKNANIMEPVEPQDVIPAGIPVSINKEGVTVTFTVV